LIFLNHFGPIGPDKKNRRIGAKHAIDTGPLAATRTATADGAVETLGNAVSADLLRHMERNAAARLPMRRGKRPARPAPEPAKPAIYLTFLD
jgi:hypothetical protein